jgi:RNA polymerase sigma factor (sigma-70 family)
MNEVNQHPVISDRDTQVQLSQRVQAGLAAHAELDSDARPSRKRRLELEKLVGDGHEAKEKFLHGNLRLVVSLAYRQPRVHGIDMSDYIDEGNLGLSHAIDKFDWRKGFKFSTYATWWINRYMRLGWRKLAPTIKPPDSLNDELSSLGVYERNGYTDEQIIAAMGLGGQADLDYMRETQRELRLGLKALEERLGYDADGTEFGETLADPHGFDFTDMTISEDIVKVLRTILDDRELFVFTRHAMQLNGEQDTLGAIGGEIGKTHEGARVIEMKAFAKLMHPVYRELVNRIRPEGGDVPAWWDEAACWLGAAEYFFIKRGETPAKAMAICEQCPVKQECLDFAVKHKLKSGIWGGTIESGRR